MTATQVSTEVQQAEESVARARRHTAAVESGGDKPVVYDKGVSVTEAGKEYAEARAARTTRRDAFDKIAFGTTEAEAAESRAHDAMPRIALAELCFAAFRDDVPRMGAT